MTTVRVGGLARIIGASAFMAVFAFLAARAGMGFAGMFRNVTVAVAPVSPINNYLLPLWMIVFGVVLLRLPDQK